MSDVTKTVKSSGGDYTSLNAALAGMSGNLTTNCGGTGSAGILTIECYAMEDTIAVSVGAGYTTSGDYYINVTVPSSERHDGKWNTNKYRHKYTGDANSISITAQHLRISYLQLESSDTTWRMAIKSDTLIANSPYLYVVGCIIKPTSATNRNLYAIKTPDNLQLIAYNNLIYNFSTDGSSGITCRHDTADCIICNNTFVNVTEAIILDGWEHGDIKNNLFYQCGSHGYGYARELYNNATSLSSFGDLSGASSGDNRISQTFTFVDAAHGDFHLASNDAGARDYGTDLSAYFTTDIDGQTRSGTWDIGADEYVVASSIFRGSIMNSFIVR